MHGLNEICLNSFRIKYAQSSGRRREQNYGGTAYMANVRFRYINYLRRTRKRHSVVACVLACILSHNCHRLISVSCKPVLSAIIIIIIPGIGLVVGLGSVYSRYIGRIARSSLR